MILSQMQLAYLYYIELSLTVLKNCSLCVSLNLFEAPERGKTTSIAKATKIDKKSTVDILGMSRFAASGLRFPKVTANFKSYLRKYLD